VILKVLLVDDNQVFLTAVRKCLATLPGVDVIAEAHDGCAALEKAEQLHPDLVLLDIAMPKLNGLEVARTMQAWPNAPRIVFLSMYDSGHYKSAAHDLGVLGFVSKSDFVVQLLPIISELLTNMPQGTT
jgi:DNA-binding NarL/FixJ family response regulator